MTTFNARVLLFLALFSFFISCSDPVDNGPSDVSELEAFGFHTP